MLQNFEIAPENYSKFYGFLNFYGSKVLKTSMAKKFFHKVFSNFYPDLDFPRPLKPIIDCGVRTIVFISSQVIFVGMKLKI